MRKLIMFFMGLVLLVLVTAMLFLTSAIYDTGASESISTYFFQTDNLSVMRPGTPVRASEIGETAMREMLIKKYVTEYFYAIPDVENIAVRTRSSSVLARMSSTPVFNDWANGEATEIQSLAEEKMMRTVDIDGEIYKPSDSDYWVVPYVLRTWTNSNDMSSQPKITRGILLMDIFFDMNMRDTIDVGQYLKHGYNRFETEYDPAAIFRFRVTDLRHVAND